ncbi:MAG TPA: winged helix DNA-binding domain-containing protein [Candidatus Limnocylindrales bacterium]|nr:winged helix DNA-binding domain-containing protein [Candidatus Limnocylindrales bacterium]
MTALPRISTAARRARLATRQALAPNAAAGSPEEVARRLVGIHGTDPTSTYIACWTRVPGFESPQLEAALFDERSLIRTYGMRRTQFLVPLDLASVVHAACATLVAGQRARLERLIAEAGITDEPAEWLVAVEAQTLEALRRSGGSTAAELSAEVEGLRARIPFGEGRRWQGEMGVSTRVLMLLSGENRILRGRPRGSFVSSLYQWVPTDAWVPGALREIPEDEAQAELVRRYLGTYGPATTRDVRWWTGWTVAETKRALGALRAIEVELDDGARGWVLPGDAKVDDPAAAGSRPWVALLAALDSTIMGWQERGWYLGEHAPRLFDTNGNAGPTIWLDGRAVGAWAQRRSGEIRWQLLEDVGADARSTIEARVAALAAWLGERRFLPRFRTPLEQELGA